jgi:hypothetical protein
MTYEAGIMPPDFIQRKKIVPPQSAVYCGGI